MFSTLVKCLLHTHTSSGVQWSVRMIGQDKESPLWEDMTMTNNSKVNLSSVCEMTKLLYVFITCN